MSLIVVLVSLLLFPSAVDIKTLIDPLVEPLLKDKPTVGLIVGVYSDGKPLLYGYGKVNTPEGKVEPNGDTLFEIGSITKAFTGILLAEAVARKEVALDDPANKHLPKDLQIQSIKKPITLLHLATHRSGLYVQPPLIGLLTHNSKNPYGDYTHARLVRLMEVMKPSREPGEQYEYSNLAVGLLGHALVNAAGMDSYNALVQDRIAKPLGLKDTTEALTGSQKARLAQGHDSSLKPTEGWDFACLEACGGLKSSGKEMLRFAAANLGEIKTPLLPVLLTSQEKRAVVTPDKMDIGLCWHRIQLKNGTEVVWHNGGTYGYRSMLAMTPATKKAVVVLCAADLSAEIDKLALGILDQLQPK